MRCVRLSWVIFLVTGQIAWGAELQRLESVQLKGEVAKPKNISALGTVGAFLVVGADEGNQVQIFQRKGDHYGLVRKVALNETGTEIDIEGIACEGRTVYVVGSHSWKRETLDDDAAYKTNRKALETLGPPMSAEDSRDVLYRFTLNAKGKPRQIQQSTLRPVLEKLAVLQLFSRIPSKENGVDIEGIAVHDEKLYLGFRGPVLRENYVPVVTCEFRDPVGTADLLYVPLGGRGIRDLTRVKGGFLILAGPVGDGPGSYQLYFWDGQDCLPGRRDAGQRGRLEFLSDIPTEDAAKAEGITVIEENDSGYELLIVYDGLKNGGASRVSLTKR